ncbi:MAG: beta-ketoacyl-ACP synthase III [Deltaproteobacteria bacterium]
MKKIGILGLGKYLPEKVLTNADLEKMVDTSDEWITTRTGIKERRIAAPDQATSDLAVRAGRQALADAKLEPKDIGLIIVTTVTADHQFPSTACYVQAALGARDAICFDIQAACSGFIYGLSCAENFLKAGSCKYALVVSAETMSRFTDWQDRSTCVLFGDGAGAAVVGEVENGGIIASYMGADGTKTDLLDMAAGGSRLPASAETVAKRQHFVHMEGNEIFKIAVLNLADAAQAALRKAELKCSDVDWIIPHQANLRIINALSKRLGFVNAQVYVNIERYGNMSSASTATALVEAVQENKIKKGDNVLLVAFGAGLVWGAMIMEWPR